MQATVTDLRFRSKALLEKVASGEEIVITYRGEPAAKLVPMVDHEPQGLDENSLFGMWKDYDALQDVDGYLRSLRGESTRKV